MGGLPKTWKFDLKKVKVFVVDEADKMTDEFFDDLNRVKNNLKSCPTQMVLLSATFDQKIIKSIDT